MKMHIGGEWVERDEKIEVVNPYDNSVIDTVPRAGLQDMETAVASAARGAKRWRRFRATADSRS